MSQRECNRYLPTMLSAKSRQRRLPQTTFDSAGMAVAFQKNSALLQTDFSNLMSEYERRQQSADVLEAAEGNYRSAQQKLDRAKQRLDYAKYTRDLCKGCPDFEQRDNIWKGASEKYNAAEHELSKTNHDLRDAQKRNQEVTHGTTWDLDEVKLRLAELKDQAAERQKRVGAKQKVATELKVSLSARFKVENAPRGVVIYPPGHDEMDVTLERDYQSVVDAIRRYHATQVEIEITEPWNNTSSQQEDARRESEKLRDFLVARRLPPEICTARGNVRMPTGNKPSERSVSIIVSGLSTGVANQQPSM